MSVNDSLKLSRLVITCGGTGGHFYPGLSIALAARQQGTVVLLLLSGVNSAAQSKIAENAGIEAVVLPQMPHPGSPVSAWRFIRGALGGWRKASSCFRDFKPQAVLGMGSFAMTPVLLAARKGLLPEKKKLCADDIMDKPFITMSENYSMHNLTQKICRDLGFRPRIALQSEDPVYVRRCVALGLGVAFVPALSWRGQFADEVTLHPVGRYSREVCIYRRQNPHAPEYVHDFYHILVEEFEREMSET